MSAGQAVGGLVGGVVGFFVGGPAGAAIGFSIGMAAGGLLDPPKGPSQPGPQINDKNFQTAKYGDMLPRFYGTIPVHGNVTWIENGALKVTIRKKKSGGKGGSAKAAPVAYYSATFFLSLGIGPIAGIRRIWCSDKLIYNAGSDDLETIIASNQAATGFKVYLGTDDQLPDPRYEADVGVGNAPAYRGEAYIAFYDFQLADYGNTLQGAQFKVEVVQRREAAEPELLRAQTLPAPAIFHQATGMHVSADGEMTVFKAQAAFTTDQADVLVAGTSGHRFERTITLSDQPFVQGWADVPQAVIRVGATVRTINTDGGETGRWNLADVEWNTARFYRRNDTDYILKWLATAAPNTTEIYQGDSGAFDIAPELISVTSNASPHGRIYDIFPAPDGIYALTYTRQLICYSYDWIEQWVLDLSTQIGIEVVRNGSIGSVLRTDVPGAVFIRSARDFWRASQSGFSYLGEAPELDISNDSLGGDAVLGDVWVSYSPTQNALQYVNMGVESYPLPSLAEVVEAEVALSSLLTPADIDAALLTQPVRGYRVAGGSIRSALEPLQGAYPFDIIPSGYQLKCVPRGQASAMTIPWEDLGASDGDTPGDLLKESREMDTQLPALVSIKYLDAAREYAIGEQGKSRINTQAINRVDREVSLVMTADEAAQMADILVNLPWLERTPASFSLPPPYLALEPADVVTIVAPWATFELRLTEGNYTPSGRTEWEAKPNRAALYTSTAKGGEGVAPDGTIPLTGPSLVMLFDIPTVNETLQNAPGYGTALTGTTSGWSGGVLMRSADNGQTWQELQGYTGRATFGYARSDLAANSGALIDQGSVLTVDLISGELESVTQEQMLAGANFAAYGVNGRWEIIRFQLAVLQADGSYQLSQLLRGDKGSEWATGLHQAGDSFILLDDPDNIFVDAPVESLGLARTYRAVTSGQAIDSASDVPFTYQGVNLRPLSPAYPVGSRNGAGDLAASVTRRSRLSSSWWITGVSAPVGETTEAYEWEVMDGSTVKRTISSTTPAITYTAAQQVADFGSTQAAITLRIYQLSSVVGRGLPLEITL